MVGSVKSELDDGLFEGVIRETEGEKRCHVRSVLLVPLESFYI